jgi:hypothetical protein
MIDWLNRPSDLDTICKVTWCRESHGAVTATPMSSADLTPPIGQEATSSHARRAGLGVA